MKKMITVLLLLCCCICFIGCNEQKEVDPYETEKTGLISEMEDLYNLDRYNSENQTKITNLLRNYISSIEAATSLEEINRLKEEYILKVDDIPEKDLSKAMITATNTLRGYEAMKDNYNLENKNKLSEYISKAYTDLLKIKKTDKVTEYMEKLQENIMNIKELREEGSLGINGDFLQPNYCQTWDKLTFQKKFKMLKSAGIHQVLIQWTYDATDSGFIYYKSSIIQAGTVYANMLDNLLSAAEEEHMQIFIGLNLTDDWWNPTYEMNEKWLNTQAETGVKIAKEIYDLYHDKYPNAFYGWYFAFEFFCIKKTGIIGYEKFNSQWANMLNIYLDGLTEIDNSIPLLFSPYYSDYYSGDYDSIYEQWSYFIKNARFRKGDVLAPQDSFGGRSVDFVQEDYDRAQFYLKAMSDAAKLNSNLKFWVNIETFTKDYMAENISRIEKQIELAKTFTNHLIMFSYIHYYDPEVAGSSYDTLYKEYLSRLYENQ